jgi:hypothetical protein
MYLIKNINFKNQYMIINVTVGFQKILPKQKIIRKS